MRGSKQLLFPLAIVFALAFKTVLLEQGCCGQKALARNA